MRRAVPPPAVVIARDAVSGSGRVGSVPAMIDDPDSRTPSTDDASPAGDAARTAGRGLLWLAIAVAVVVVLAGVFMLGPFGLAIVVPAVILIWFVAGASSGTPAAGA
jgi:hypothetical protein